MNICIVNRRQLGVASTTRLKKKASFYLMYNLAAFSLQIHNCWKALEKCFLMPQTRSLYLYLLWKNNVSKR